MHHIGLDPKTLVALLLLVAMCGCLEQRWCASLPQAPAKQVWRRQFSLQPSGA